MNATAQALADARKKITTLQGEMTTRIVKLAKEIEKLEASLPIKEARAFLTVRCGLASTDISTLAKFSRTLKDHENLIEKRRVPFPVIKRLVSASEAVRREALSRIASGARFDTADVSAIRKRIAEEEFSHEEMIAKSRVRAVTRFAQKRNREALAKLDAGARVLMEKVATLPESSSVTSAFLDAATDIAQDARNLLPTFETLLGSEHKRAGKPGWREARPLERRFGAAHGALSYLARAATDNKLDLPNLAKSMSARRSSILMSVGAVTGDTRFLMATLPPSVPKGLATLPDRRLTALEFCAGAGGMALGLEAAGFHHVGLVEVNKDAAATMRLNRPDWPVIEQDMTTLDFGVYAGKVDLVCGGLPCQPYSEEGEGLGKDDPRDLLLQGARAVREIQPKAFLFENVRGVLHGQHSDQIAAFVKELSDAGYDVQIVEVNTRDYGIAQDRPRILIVGLRHVQRKHFKMPPIFPGRRANVGDVLYDLMAANGWKRAKNWAKARREQSFELEDGTLATGALAYTLTGRKGKAQYFEGLRWAKIGLSPAGLPDEAPTDKEARAAGKGFVPALTLRMRARLQNFEDSYVFAGGKESIAKQIGNAVAPRMAQAVGLALYSVLCNVDLDFEAILWPEPSDLGNASRRLIVNPPALDHSELAATKGAAVRPTMDFEMDNAT